MNSLRNAARILLEIIREIFDEASYARFLQREQMQSSPQAYAAFWGDREGAHARRPKCC
jgi:hypothetical protein